MLILFKFFLEKRKKINILFRNEAHKRSPSAKYDRGTHKHQRKHPTKVEKKSRRDKKNVIARYRFDKKAPDTRSHTYPWVRQGMVEPKRKEKKERQNTNKKKKTVYLCSCWLIEDKTPLFLLRKLAKPAQTLHTVILVCAQRFKPLTVFSVV
jgi:hypothetical protein